MAEQRERIRSPYKKRFAGGRAKAMPGPDLAVRLRHHGPSPAGSIPARRSGGHRVDRQAYIDHILDHFQHPRHKGRLPDADVQLGGGNPGCGDLITMYVKVGDDDRCASSQPVWRDPM